jgi:hypothetical protein
MLFRSPLPADVADDFGRADDFAIRRANRRDGNGNIDILAILPAADRFIVIDPLSGPETV